jgi:riboflavin kinase / FMN adenylyltransferase
MPHIQTLDGFFLERSCATVGSFDGVHFGHSAILQSLVEDAHRQGIPAVVITFSPHPAFILRGIQAHYYLTTAEEKADLLLQSGVDWVITLPFTRQLAALPAETFIQNIQMHLNMQQLWIGYDFTLGKDQKGDYSTLKNIGNQIGFKVNLVPPFILDGEIVSSSGIRQMIQAGNVEQAARHLGRWYFLNETVTHGDGRGQGLGFPTANLEFNPERLLPASGVYATRAHIDGEIFQSVTNVGYRPTFNHTPENPLVEVHFIKYNQLIYGKKIKLEFIGFLRKEIRFENVQELIAQMHHDVDNASEVLSDVQSPPSVFA